MSNGGALQGAVAALPLNALVGLNVNQPFVLEIDRSGVATELKQLFDVVLYLEYIASFPELEVSASYRSPVRLGPRTAGFQPADLLRASKMPGGHRLEAHLPDDTNSEERASHLTGFD